MATKPATCTRKRGEIGTLKSHDFTLRNGEWYTARVHIRGSHLICSIYDSHNSTETPVFDVFDDRHPSGRVGLRTFGASVRFKNIKVTAPDGQILWEGPPLLGPTTQPEFSKQADQVRPSAVDRGGFVQLFNGIDRTGWKTDPSQPGNWHIENGLLVGSGPGPVSHLYTVRNDYKDFHLRAEARINDVGNSGVCFRSAYGPSWPANEPRYPLAYEAQIYSKARDRNYTGSLFAGVKGAVVTVNVRPVLPLEWFTLEVIAQGNHVVVKVNGMMTADYTDADRLFSTGHIALQQHGPQTVVEFRKIEIRELPPGSVASASRDQEATRKDAGADNSRESRGFVPLFNGRDIDGWTAWGVQGRLSKADASGIWWVRDGVLHGSGGLYHLFSLRGDYKNFRVRVEAMINEGGNSGIFLRVAEGAGHLPGLEAQINSTHGDPNKTGSLYHPPDAPIRVNPSPVLANTWFELDAEVVGGRVRIWVDRTLYVDLGRSAEDVRPRPHRHSSSPSAIPRQNTQTRGDGAGRVGKTHCA